jgi:hypothetical protein
MICNKCKLRTASIIVVDKDGLYTDDGVFCCWCFVIDFREKLDKLTSVPVLNDAMQN